MKVQYQIKCRELYDTQMKVQYQIRRHPHSLLPPPPPALRSHRPALCPQLPLLTPSSSGADITVGRASAAGPYLRSLLFFMQFDMR
jgi:hypothetical protein